MIKECQDMFVNIEESSAILLSSDHVQPSKPNSTDTSEENVSTISNVHEHIITLTTASPDKKLQSRTDAEEELNLIVVIKEEEISDHEIYECERCDEAFSLFSDFKSHFLTHNDTVINDAYNSIVPKHTCEKCKKSFLTERQLKRHSRIHGIREYACNICSKSFIYKHQLKDHETLHSGDKRYKIQIIFPQKPNIKFTMSYTKATNKHKYSK